MALKLRQYLKRVRWAIRTAARAIWNVVHFDFADVCFFGGIALIGAGIGGRFGLIVAGSLLVLSVRPLLDWLKRPDGK